MRSIDQWRFLLQDIGTYQRSRVIIVKQLLYVTLQLLVAGALVAEPRWTLVGIDLDGAKKQVL